MNHRFTKIRGLVILLGTILPATAGEQQLQTGKKTNVVTTTDYHTAGYRTVRQLTGELSLVEAVNIALRQNPAILTQIQEIQRTRGEIIEARAAALPQITLTGAYEHQDDRLLKGGGESTGSSTLPNSPVSAPSQLAIATSNGLNTTGTQAITPIAPIGTAGAGNTGTNSTSTGSGTTAGTTAAATAPAGGGAIVSREAARVVDPRPAVVTRAVTATPTGTTTTTTGPTGSTTTSSSGSTSTSVNQLLKELGSQNGTGQTGPVQNQSWNITIEVKQVLYAGGQIDAAIKIAKFSQDSAYFQLRDTIDTIVSTVRTQFFDVLLNRALITVQEESVRLLEQQLQDQRNRFEAGTVPRFNVLQAEVALANQRPSLISARNNYLLAQIQLAKTLGISPGANGKPTFFCVGELGVPERHVRLAEALDLAHARRPFLKVQRESILIEAEDIKVQMAGYKPELDAHAGYELRNRSSSTDISDTVNGWFFGVSGSWAIFDGFGTYGRVKQARARLEEAKLNYDDSVQQVDLQVQTAYANMQQSRETIGSQQENVKEALEAVRLAQERLNAGAGTQLDVLNAEVQLTTARTTELQARGNYNISLAQFDLATATDTVYDEKFKDPLEKVQKGVFARLAETGLPPVPPTSETPAAPRGRSGK